MDDVKPNVERKFWQGPVKHTTFGAGAMAAVIWLTPMKHIFYSREEGTANTAQIEELKTIVKDGFAHQESLLFAHVTEETHKHERMVDTLRLEIKNEKDDRVREVDLVENLFKMKHAQTN